ncbi:MAG TPA: hypothetical protein O0X27_06325 [Methanocorpusculum sp.]|nr:hypothetical protein [Methanocorpusculum sp.]
MSLFPALIFDANVLTYLHKLGFLATCINAVEHPFTFDIIRDVELKDMPWADVVRANIDVLSLDGEQMANAYAYTVECRGLTISDAGLILLGRIYGHPVFTEDKLMIHELERLHLPHITLLEVLEGLVSANYISRKAGVVAVDRIASELLPGRYPIECFRLQTLFSV